MQQFKKLAIAGAVSALMMGTTAAQAHISYNTNTSLANGSASNPATWTAGVPDGYVGNLPSAWVANIHHHGTQTVSTAGANPVGFETGYVIETLNNKWNPIHSWGNALDMGLIDMDVAGDLTVSVKADVALSSTFMPGFTLWQGWDTSATSSRHGSWNADASNPGNRGADNLSYLGHAATNSQDGGAGYSYNNSNGDHMVEITFENLAAGKYSLWIGGNGTTGAEGKDKGKISIGQQYIASITSTASPVPVPAAAWLLGSGLLGLLGMRRKQVSA